MLINNNSKCVMTLWLQTQAFCNQSIIRINRCIIFERIEKTGCLNTQLFWHRPNWIDTHMIWWIKEEQLNNKTTIDSHETLNDHLPNKRLLVKWKDSDEMNYMCNNPYDRHTSMKKCTDAPKSNFSIVECTMS